MKKALYLLTSLLPAAFFYGEILTYNALTDNKTERTTFELTKKGEDLFITGKNSNTLTKIECNSDYEMESFFQQKEKTGTEVFLSRIGTLLKVQVREGKKEKNLSYDIATKPWIQEFKFGFQPFLASAKKELTFCVINPNGYSLHDMIAKKEAVESVVINGREYFAQKISITLTGFKKRFWKAYAWFDTQTHDLIKYRANEGPGTPTTEITLGVKE